MKHELTTRETRNYHQTVREDARSYSTRPASILVVLIGGQRSPGEQCSPLGAHPVSSAHHPNGPSPVSTY